MAHRSRSKQGSDRRVAEWAWLILGIILLLASPLVGALPGPGGLVVAGLGLALILKNSIRAKRHYARFKRSQPRVGRWTDKALNRRSAKLRHLRRAAQHASTGN